MIIDRPHQGIAFGNFAECSTSSDCVPLLADARLFCVISNVDCTPYRGSGACALPRERN